jgi:hypothetical protein
MNPPKKKGYVLPYSYVDMADSLRTMADSLRTMAESLRTMADSLKIHEYAMSLNE